MASSYIGKPCPKCAHVRTASETAPDWQCPKCGIVYAKFGQEAPAVAHAPVVRRGAHAAASNENNQYPRLAKLAHQATRAK
jgi:ribosomal protein L37AE/L43A